MANSQLKKEVLKAFKSLHRTRQYVFEGDRRTLEAARDRINQEFKTNRNETDEQKIHEMLGLSKAVEEELRTTVIQAREKTTGRFELRITPETKMLDNLPFDPDVEIPRAKRRELAKACCNVKIE